MKIAFTLLAWLACSAIMYADQPPADWFREQPFPGLGQPQKKRETVHFVRMATHPRMHEDMHLEAGRRKKLNEIRQAVLDDQAQLVGWLGIVDEQPPPAEEMRRKQELKDRETRIWQAAKLRVEAFLSAEQIQRIRQIMVQQLRHQVFLDRDYAAKLKLDENQREALQLNWKEHLDRVKQQGVNGRQSYHQFWDNAYMILTDEQRRKFEELRGPPLEETDDQQPSPAEQTSQEDIIGTVLGRAVSRDELRKGASQRDELARLFLNPVLEKYRADHRKELELTEQEIARAIQYHEQRTKKKGGNTADAWRRVKEQQKQDAEKSLQEIESQLASQELQDADRDQLLKRKREAELLIKQPGRAFAQRFYGSQKFQQYLYREYGGGRVLFQQFGMEAFDAMHRWLKGREQAGDFRIDDPELRSKLYEYWTDTKMHGAFLSTPDDKQDPIELRFPWERDQTEAKRRDEDADEPANDPAGGPESWGPAVEGLQARLRTGITTWRMGESAAFLADVRNTGKTPRTIPLTQARCELEFNGEVYRWASPVNDDASQLAPGRTVSDVPVVLISTWKNEKGKPLNLTAGKHRVRAIFLAEREGEDAAPTRVPSNVVRFEVTSKQAASASRKNGLDESWTVRRLLPARFWSDRATIRRSDTPVKIEVANKAVQGNKIALSLAITNKSKSPIQVRLPYEWHGGIWPPTDLYASVTPIGSKDRVAFHEVFLLGENPSLKSLPTIESGETIDLAVRMDWPGTGSSGTQPLMNANLAKSYDVQFLLAFTRGRKAEYVAGPKTRVELAPAKPKDETRTEGDPVRKTSSVPHQPLSARTVAFNPPAPVPSHPVSPSKIWSGGFTENDDPDRWNAMPERGYVINSNEWKTLWKAWRPVTSEPPAVDFSKELVFGCAIRGPYGITPEFRLNDEGKLTTRHCIRQNTGGGFHSIMFKIPREGIKRVNFHKLAAAPQRTSQVDGKWGSVSGRVVWKGPVSGRWGVEGLTVDEQNQGIRDAIVFLESKPEQIHPDYLGNKPAPAKMVYSNRDFRPRSLVLQVGQPIELTSIDPRRAGNIWPRNLTNNQEFNVTVAKKPFVWTPKQPEPSPVRIVNMADPLARSNWLIVDHPYATVTGRDGSFRLEKLPAGEHTLAIWHEAAGYLVRGLKVKVQAGQVVEVRDQTLTVRQIPRMRLKAPLPTWSEIETVNNMQARLTIDDYGSDTVNGVKSAFAVIEIRNSNGPYAVDFRLSDKKQTELQILDADGEPVEKVKLHFRARKHFPDHGSLPPHCYFGLRTFGSGVDVSRSLDHATFVAWGHAWHLSPGTYTLQGTLELSVREDIPNKETPWKDVSLKLAPIEFVVPQPPTDSPD